MSVLKGEGKVPILFGSASIAVGTLTHRGYLARPDLAGEWPTIVVVPSEWGVTSSTKDLCRRLARQGFAILAVDMYRGKAPDRRAASADAAAASRAIPAGRAAADLGAIGGYIANPAGFWSNAESGFGILALGEGARFAVPFAAANPGLAVALVASRLNPPEPQSDDPADGPPIPAYPNAAIGGVVGPLLGLSGRDDPSVSVEDVMQLRRLAPHAEWVLYDGVGAHFSDDYTDGYDAGAHRDTIERLTDFFMKHLPDGPGSQAA